MRVAIVVTGQSRVDYPRNGHAEGGVLYQGPQAALEQLCAPTFERARAHDAEHHHEEGHRGENPQPKADGCDRRADAPRWASRCASEVLCGEAVRIVDNPRATAQ